MLLCCSCSPTHTVSTSFDTSWRSVNIDLHTTLIKITKLMFSFQEQMGKYQYLQVFCYIISLFTFSSYNTPFIFKCHGSWCMTAFATLNRRYELSINHYSKSKTEEYVKHKKRAVTSTGKVRSREVVRLEESTIHKKTGYGDEYSSVGDHKREP